MTEPTSAEIKEALAQTERDMQATIAERRAKLPAVVDAPARDNTVILLPLHDGRIHYACAKGIMEVIPYVSGILDHPHSSLVTLSRNKLVNGFLKTPFQWAVMIDSDIEFTARDFGYLMGPGYDNDSINALAARAPYARKDDSEQVISTGLGFALVHRTVLELIREEIAVPFQHDGQMMHDFFITGATSSGGFLGEDGGFWWLCSQVGVIPREERRCNLVHWGAKGYRMPAIEYVAGRSL